MNQFFNFLKRNLGIIIIFVSFAAVIISGLISGVLSSAIESITNADPFYIILALAFYLGHSLVAGIAHRSFIKTQGHDVSLKEAFYSSIIGTYYSNITPAATGGIPTEIYCLGRQGVPAGIASSAITCFIIAWYIMRLLLICLLLILRSDLIFGILGSKIIFLFFGLLYNLYVIVLFLVLGFAKKPVRFIITLIDKINRKLKLSKDPEKIENILSSTAKRYHDSMQSILLHPSEIIKQLFLGCLYTILLNSIIYLSYRSLGLSGTPYYDIFAMSLCQNVSAAYMPTPGGAGAQEIIYQLFFGTMIKGSSLLAVMLIWRFVSFYFSLFLGAILSSVRSIHRQNRQ